MNLGALLLPIVTGLLLEELTFGGLVRLLLLRGRGSGDEESTRTEREAGNARTKTAAEPGWGADADWRAGQSTLHAHVAPDRPAQEERRTGVYA